MSDKNLGVAEIIELMEAFRKNDMGALKLKNGEFSLTLRSKGGEVVVAGTPVAQPVAVTQAADTAVASDEAEQLKGVVPSPIVGTFYAAPAPDKDPFVKVGQQVKQGDVLFIIESMKLMNEVLCEKEGTITKILVENAQPVEYGQPILCVE